jgi:uncharacterized protein (TIGR02145 family)
MRKLNLLLTALVFIVGFGYSQTVNIGSQVWCTKNLDVTTFRNGTPIPEAKTDEEWIKARNNKQPAWCYYENNSANGTTYGKLYNWHAVNDPRGLAPVGYHIPTDAEWRILKNNLGTSIGGNKMKSTNGWINGNNGSNSSGFSGLPGGFREGNGEFKDIISIGNWWSYSVDQYILSLDMLSEFNLIQMATGEYNKGKGLSVRCLKD